MSNEKKMPTYFERQGRGEFNHRTSPGGGTLSLAIPTIIILNVAVVTTGTVAHGPYDQLIVVK